MSSLLTYLEERLAKERSVLSEDIVTGKAADYAEYRYSCGKHRGLLIASDIVAELIERMREDGDPE